MVIADEYVNILLQGVSSGFPHDNMWYLDTCVSSHMIGMKSSHQSIDENYKERVRFGDGSSIRCEGKGKVLFDSTNGEHMIFEIFHFIPKLKTNILILGKLDGQSCDIHMRKGFLTLHDNK